ncbi:hypothetical protein Pcinc_018303 [Petrolisthes cinctipes]|uniref:Uncharacterized protein n=1 Tax=Petrolisthes cinctipes TaxID=88211 RepID=A0AAE1KMW7_PETCI|nr:hypothetical protein Pcinc_032266 [Petrolisthes cinctipes]KAK3876952.1 hypothetical protein Pcinc_018303 [Petrolisthes cinctipes]
MSSEAMLSTCFVFITHPAPLSLLFLPHLRTSYLLYCLVFPPTPPLHTRTLLSGCLSVVTTLYVPRIYAHVPYNDHLYAPRIYVYVPLNNHPNVSHIYAHVPLNYLLHVPCYMLTYLSPTTSTCHAVHRSHDHVYTPYVLRTRLTYLAPTTLHVLRCSMLTCPPLHTVHTMHQSHVPRTRSILHVHVLHQTPRPSKPQLQLPSAASYAFLRPCDSPLSATQRHHNAS